MKKLLFLLTFLAFNLTMTSTEAYSQRRKSVSVKSYSKKDGTKVRSHKRSSRGSKSRANLFLKTDKFNNVATIDKHNDLIA